MLNFFTVLGIGTPPPGPPPLPQASVSPLPLVSGGPEAQSLAGEGVGESQLRRGDIHCDTLYICTLYKLVGGAPPAYRNAEFMYPEMPWKTISVEAKQCIQHFLVVKHDDRAHTKPNTTILATNQINSLNILNITFPFKTIYYFPTLNLAMFDKGFDLTYAEKFLDISKI